MGDYGMLATGQIQSLNQNNNNDNSCIENLQHYRLQTSKTFRNNKNYRVKTHSIHYIINSNYTSRQQL